jgi:allantoinase
MQLDLVVRAKRAVMEAGAASSSVGVREGRVVAVERYDAALAGSTEVVLADDEVLMPGLVDTHVHVNEPGRADWEGFSTATRAAAAGGVTTIVDMPLNSIPATVEPAALEAKRDAAAGQAVIDVGFWGGAVPGNLTELRRLHEAGVRGFKCFLLDSGVPEFPPLPDEQLRQAMAEIASFGGLLLVHAEDAQWVHPAPSCTAYSDFLATRPAEAESRAVARVIEGTRATGCRTHIVHVSSASVLPLLADARAEGLPVSAETCPHYLCLTAEDVPDGATEFKCCPPIRDRGNADELWDGLRDGVLDLVVSDHSPSPQALKQSGDFGTAWGGICSLQVSLPAVWTAAMGRGFSLSDVARWMAAAPAQLVGFDDKGAIAVGRDADFCLFAPDATWLVDAGRLEHRHPVTPYHGRTLTGVVRSTWLRGERIDLDDPSRGRLL